MTVIQLNPIIPVMTPKGSAMAHFLIDYSPDHHLVWVCFLDANGECWSYSNPEIRAQANQTMFRDNISPFYKPDDVALARTKFEE